MENGVFSLGRNRIFNTVSMNLVFRRLAAVLVSNCKKSLSKSYMPNFTGQIDTRHKRGSRYALLFQYTVCSIAHFLDIRSSFKKFPVFTRTIDRNCYCE